VTVSGVPLRSLRCGPLAQGARRQKENVLVTTLNIVTLLSLLGALGYAALAARRLDAKLAALTDEQGEWRRSTESDLQRTRQSLAELDR
jgi:hypothetical protein